MKSNASVNHAKFFLATIIVPLPGVVSPVLS